MEKRKYVPGSAVLQARKALEALRKQEPGAYQSPWKDALEKLAGTITGRGPFRYDPGSDPLYLQAVDHYVRLGRQAMEDTLGRAAAMTGGYSSSYAQTAGQQAYQRYLLSLSARMPQFQQLALQRYQAEGQELSDRFGVLQALDQGEFDRYQAAVEQYTGKLDRARQDYDRAADRDYRAFADDRAFDYTREQDEKRADWQAREAQRQQLRFEQEQAYRKQRDQVEDQQWQLNFEEGRRRHEAEMQLRQAEIAARAAAARRASSSGSRRQKENGKHTGPNNRFSREEYYGWRQSTGGRR